jgi:hypothetical protein
MQFSPPNLSGTLEVFAAMITPAVLILASGSLILTTTNRLVRVVDRVRAMLPEFEELARQEPHDQKTEEKHAMLFRQLDRATERARLIQRALTRLYLGLGLFLATSAALGIITLAKLEAAWLPLTLGLMAIALLLSASVLLIIESRISLASTYEEMDYIRQLSQHHAPPTLVKKRGRRWYDFG